MKISTLNQVTCKSIAIINSPVELKIIERTNILKYVLKILKIDWLDRVLRRIGNISEIFSLDLMPVHYKALLESQPL